MSKFWDKEAIYDEKISPLMKEIIELCKKYEMPLVAQFQIANTEDKGPFFCTTTLPFDGCDQIQQLVEMVRPKQPVVLAETTYTTPEGATHVKIRRIQ